MATVTAEHERGQLILIGALALAVSLVAIALVLNSAIYTHNLASRYDSPGDDASTFSRDAVIGAGGAIDYANHRYADQGYSTILDKYKTGLNDVEKGFAGDVGVNGRIARIQHVSGSSERGVYVADKEPGGSTFEAATPSGLLGENTDWTVAPNVRARQFHVRVDNSTLNDLTSVDAEDYIEDLTATNEGFTVEFADGSDEWRVIVYDDGGVNVMVHRVNSLKFETCTTTSTEATIEFTDAEINGDRCEPLSFVEDLSGLYTVRYYNSDFAGGSYQLTADRTIDGLSNSDGPFTDVVDDLNYGNHCDGPTYNGASSGNYPMVAPVIFQSTVEMTYDGPDITYSRQEDVAPELPGNDLVTPRVTSFDVDEADTEAGDGEFTVSWSATDPNSDAVDTIIEIVEPDGETKTFYSPGSSPATLDVDDELGVYNITLTVDDGPDDTAIDGNSRTVFQRHDDDGDETGCPP